VPDSAAAGRLAPTWSELDGPDRPTLLIVPLGAYEQHGPHLPLDTDTLIASAISDRAGEILGAAVAPALAYGASGEHAGFPGTLSIGHEALAAVIVELVRSARSTFDAVVFVSGHGGNAESLRRAEAQCRSDGDRILVWRPRVPSGDAHAGRTETSLLLAIAPQLVRTGRIAPGCTASLSDLLPELRRAGVRSVSSSGVLGDPTTATAEEGWTVLAALVADLCAAVSSWARQGASSVRR
jgi:mycofactocin precursor peptide peptidase